MDSTLPRRRHRPAARGYREARGYRDVMVDVVTEIEIARPREEVAAYASDPDNATRWYRNVESVEWETAPPVAVGSRMAFVARFLGRRLAYTYEVREIVPAERFVMSTAEGPFPMETTYTWADTPDGGTLMTLRNRGEPAGFSRIGAPMMAMAMRRANWNDLREIKRILEAENGEPRARSRPARRRRPAPPR
jgi:uncharacterized protein YndB with AHSA1/START domain